MENDFNGIELSNTHTRDLLLIYGNDDTKKIIKSDEDVKDYHSIFA